MWQKSNSQSYRHESDSDAEVSLDTSLYSIYTSDGTLDVKGNPAIKSSTGGSWTTICILGCQMGLTSANFGISYDLVLYMTRVLNQGNAKSTTLVNVWNGVTNLTCLFGAIVADSYLGDYVTSGTLCIIAFLGTVLITLSATISSLKPTPCVNETSVCPRATSAQLWFFNVALYVIAIGNGSQPCLVAFGADQFDENDKHESKKKHSYFNWYYLSLCLGSLIAGLVLVNVEAKIGFGLGFGLSAAIVGLGVVVFYGGTPIYRYRRQRHNPFGEMAKVLVAATCKWNVKVPEDSRLLNNENGQDSTNQWCWSNPHTKRFRFLDKAATVTGRDWSAVTGRANPWRLCTVAQVEHLKSILSLGPIWASIILYGTMFGQMSSFFVLQGSFMNTHVGTFNIPPATLNIVDVVTVIIVTFMYQSVMMPFMVRLTNNIQGLTHLQRIGVGQLLTVLAMACAALLEWERLQLVNPHGNAAAANLSVLWQIPQYSLIGASEVFAYIGQIEFFYDQAPEGAQSFGAALSFSAMALGNFLGGYLVTFLQSITGYDGNGGWIPQNIDHGHLDYYFWVLTFLSGINFIYFLIVASSYHYKQSQVDERTDDA
ncbi:hypothetical protein O6H91_23G034700 [Diphasiastrum complanatum]|uniref:Uncharacterized protein n=1 Tax=Diphasiastrum complanatum TaxID=34168 RepID=A0ACC2A9M5_DIPCM|nr:hypothetical protein O6H91_23G034700 [Diphasiastrum complanatum]